MLSRTTTAGSLPLSADSTRRYPRHLGYLFHNAAGTVTCLYSAGVVAVATAAPHSLQNFEFGGSSVPHDPHTTAAAVISRGQPTFVPRHYRVTAGETT